MDTLCGTFGLKFPKVLAPSNIDFKNFCMIGRLFRFVSYKRPFTCHDFDSWALKSLGEPLKFDQACPTSSTGLLSVSGFDRVYPNSDNTFMKLADDLLRDDYKPFLNRSKLISVEESILHMEKKTSPGFPWNTLYYSKGEVCSHPQFVNYVKDFLKRYESGCLLWSVSQKYELRSIEKLKEGKIRTFMVSPIEHVVGAGQFCLDFNNKFYDSGSNFYTPSVVGCSKFSGGFNRMVKRMEATGCFVFNTDASSFDQSISPEQLDLQFQMRYDFLDDTFKTHENYSVFRKLYEDVKFSLLILEDGTIVRKNGGNPSGFVNTIVDNTMILSRLLYYSWCIIMYDQDKEDLASKLNTLSEPLTNQEISFSLSCQNAYNSSVTNKKYFRDNVSYICYGDDLSFSVSKAVIDRFNFDSVNRVLSTLGFTLKGNSISVPPSSLEFLSHSVIKCPRSGLWLPVMERNKVICSLIRGFDLFDPKYILLRAYNLRIESWADVRTRKLLIEFIDFIRTNYKHQLVGSLYIPSKEINISMEDIEKSFFSDEELFLLYTGLEAASSVRPTSVLKTCIKNFYL